MSEKDRRLAQLSGLTVQQIAQLLGRKRQAIYQGFGSDRDYFSYSEVASILLEAKSRDFPYIEELETLIRKEYRDIGVKIPKHAAESKLKCAMQGSDKLVFCVNNSRRFIESYKDIFIDLLRDRPGSRRHPEIFICVANEFSKELFVKGLSYHHVDFDTIVISFHVIKQVQYMPSAIFCLSEGVVRAFVIAKDAIEEMLEEDSNNMLTVLTGEGGLRISDRRRPARRAAARR